MSNYRVSHSEKLFEIGARYFEKHCDGAHSFAITSMGYERSRQTTLLGVASYFDIKRRDLRICIISDNLYNGVFCDLIATCDFESILLGEENEELRVHRFYGHFDFIDLGDILYKEKKGLQIKDVIEEIRQEYDVVFWDVPELYKIKRNLKAYESILGSFDSIGVVAGSAGQNLKEVEEFFLEHGIKFEETIFEQPAAKSKKTRSFWSLAR